MIRYLEPWWLLAVIPVLGLIGVYVLVQIRRRTQTVRFANVELMGKIAKRNPGWKRHVPASVLLVGMLIMSTGMARPAIDTQEPTERATVILALDVSLSMEAEDVSPNRFEAMKESSIDFVDSLPEEYNLGLVS